MRNETFALNRAGLEAIADTVLAHARRLGARDATVRLHEDIGFKVGVRNALPDSTEHRHRRELSLTLHVGDRSGSGTTGDFTADGLREVSEAAIQIAAQTGEDRFAGPVEHGACATDLTPVPGLYDDRGPTMAEAVALVQEMEAAALGDAPALLFPGAPATDARRTSGGAELHSIRRQHLIATSQGFCAGYPTSLHELHCSLVAGEGGGKQRGGWQSMARDRNGLDDPRAIGRVAAARALAGLDATRIATRAAPVLFEASIVPGLLQPLTGALTGGAQFRRETFLPDSIGTRVLAPHVSISEHPHEPAGLASAPFDSEGVATRPGRIVADGVVGTYLLNAYAARRLGLDLTGHADGPHNLRVTGEGPGDGLAGMLRLLDTGLFVTATVGGGTNAVTGDYSQGVAGFWVEGGAIRHAVQEITVAGNLRDIYAGILAVGSDVHRAGTWSSGSLLIDRMQIAGL